MNKELKFRAWDDGQMIYSDEFEDSIEQERDNDYATLASFFSAIREDAIVMQFIGKTDKNGRVIYVGDIVKCYENVGTDKKREIKTWINEVCFRHGGFCLVNRNCCKHCADGFGITMWIGEVYFPIEVIGNIYENPGMLNKNEQP